MKTKFNPLFLLAFFALIGFTSCQDEVADIDNPTTQETIIPNSTLASFMSGVTANYGAYDDFLDDANCFSIELPVTIIISDITVTIETLEDLNELEELFAAYEDDGDIFEFIFPITIIFNDYTELIIENLEQLESFISECDDDEDDVIECVDFVYPISFSVFNAQFDIIDTITIENDEALYVFLDSLEDDDNALIVSLNYPVTLVYANGDTLEVTTNEELGDAIASAENDCDDDNEDYCDEEAITLALKECQWEIAAYSSFPEFQGLDLIFYEDFTFGISENGELYNLVNNWSVSSNGEQFFLNIDSDFEDLGGDWQVIECDDDRFEFVKGNQTMVLEQECNEDVNCSFNDISAILQECPWDFADEANSFSNYQMIFHQGGDLQITEGDTTSAIGGSWNLTSTDNGIIITFSELTAFQQDLGGEWLIIECDDDRIKIVRGDAYLILEQDCEGNGGNEVFDCFGVFELVECIGPNLEAEFNLSADTIGLIDCQYAFTPSFHVTQADAEANTGAIENTESYWASTSEIYLRIEAENGNFEIYPIFLNTEECNYFECFGNYNLTVCDEEDGVIDGSASFDLSQIFANCPNDDVVYDFYESVADAEAQVSPLINPFTNFSNPQVIYSRVALASDNSTYEIFTHELIVQNCNEETCTEEDVDAFLTSCIWNAVNYNGSDNLMEWNFDFEPNNQIVVIYTDSQTIDATWTTSQSNDGVIVTFSNVAGPNIQAITGEWLVVECEENRLEMHRQDDLLVLERNCD